MATTTRTDEQILVAADAGHEMAGMVATDADRAAALRVLRGETTPEQEAARVLAEIQSRHS